MSTKVDLAFVVEPPRDQTARASTSSAASTTGPKISMFKGKSGFVIPKNKLSGSLVPIFGRGKKRGSVDTANEENEIEVKRKTKWGNDLTQDASVKKGRILAYQTRLDQITKQLKSRNLEFENDLDLELATQEPDQETSSLPNNQEKLKSLELERREVIGEILKLNPSYKPPADYKPLLKEAKVPIHVKEYPGYNFIGLIYGPGSDNQKRLEKETGAKIQVYGAKENGKQKVELNLSDEKENQNDYDELYVLVSADTYEKVDAAVSLIELLVNPISGKPAPIPGDDPNVLKSIDTASPRNFPTAVAVQGVAPVLAQPTVNPPQAQFTYNGQWYPTGPPNAPMRPPSGFLPPQNPAPPNFNNPLLFGPRPVPTTNFGSFPPSPSLIPLSPRSSVQSTQHPFMPQARPFGQTSSPSVPSPQNAPGPLSFTGGQFTGPGMPQAALFPLPDRTMNSAGIQASAPISQGLSSSMLNVAPFVHPQGSRAVGTQPNVAPMPPPSNSISTGPVISPHLPQGGSFAASRTPVPNPSPAPLHGSGPGPLLGPSGPNFTPIMPQNFATPKPESNSGNFTFQPHRPQNPNSQPPFWPSNQPGNHNSLPTRPLFQPPLAPPQAPPHLNVHNSAHNPNNQMFPMPQHNNQIGYNQVPFGRNLNQMSTSPRVPPFPGPGFVAPPSTPNAAMGPRSFNPSNQMLDFGDPHSSRPQNPMQFQQNFAPPPTRPGNFSYPNQRSINPSMAPGRPSSNPSGGQKFYDPFSPSAVSHAPQQQLQQKQRDSSVKLKDHENDPEYEDLMASVGVK